MQCVAKTARIPLPKPNTFAGLMELYENNYIKLRKLCNNFDNLHENSISRVDQGLDLYLQVIERSRYTVTLNLTYRFSNSEQGEFKALPNLLIRIYFDAMQAEVLQRSVKRPVDVCFESKKNLNNKWQNNRFLFKWLSFCLHQGHSFRSESSRLECS